MVYLWHVVELFEINALQIITPMLYDTYMGDTDTCELLLKGSAPLLDHSFHHNLGWNHVNLMTSGFRTYAAHLPITGLAGAVPCGRICAPDGQETIVHLKSHGFAF